MFTFIAPFVIPFWLFLISLLITVYCNNLSLLCTPGFKTMVQFMFSGKETIVTSIQDLDLLFEIFRLADKVAVLFSITLTIDKLYPDWQYILSAQ